MSKTESLLLQSPMVTELSFLGEKVKRIDERLLHETEITRTEVDFYQKKVLEAISGIGEEFRQKVRISVQDTLSKEFESMKSTLKSNDNSEELIHRIQTAIEVAIKYTEESKHEKLEQEIAFSLSALHRRMDVALSSVHQQQLDLSNEVSEKIFEYGQKQEIQKRSFQASILKQYPQIKRAQAKHEESLARLLADIQIQQQETEMFSARNQLRLKAAQSAMEQRANEQLSEVQSRKMDLAHKMNRTQIEMLEQKINMLGSAFDIVSQEYTNKLMQDFPRQIDDLREGARTLPAKELSEKLNNFMGGMNLLLEGMPETLNELKTQVLQAANDIEDQTRMLLPDIENPEIDK